MRALWRAAPLRSRKTVIRPKSLRRKLLSYGIAATFGIWTRWADPAAGREGPTPSAKRRWSRKRPLSIRMAQTSAGLVLTCNAWATWKNGKLKALGPLSGGNNSVALSLNDRGQVIGFSDSDVYSPDCAATAGFQFQPVIWEPNGHVRQLSPLPGDTIGFGFGINNRGQAVGASGVCANTTPPIAPNAPHAVLWERDGTPVDLGSLGGSQNIASSVSNRGDVAGTAFTPEGSPHAFLWTKSSGKMKDLGTVPGFVGFINPCCNTINDRREIVGFMFDADFNSRAFYYRKANMVDLNSLLSRHAQTEWVLQAAQSINEFGQIAGYGLHNGQTRAFLATPCQDRDGSGESCEDRGDDH